MAKAKKSTKKKMARKRAVAPAILPASAKSDSAGAIIPTDAQTESFVRGLIQRGEAAKPGPNGKLPAGATHEIVGQTATGLPIVVRKRFTSV